jgi:hypothetical protein
VPRMTTRRCSERKPIPTLRTSWGSEAKKPSHNRFAKKSQIRFNGVSNSLSIDTLDVLSVYPGVVQSLQGKETGIQFRTWTVDQGPTVWHERDVWTEIEGHLASNDVRSAAGLYITIK